MTFLGPTISEVIPGASGMPDLNHGQPKTNADFEKFIFDLSQKPNSKIKADTSRRTVYVLYVPCDDNGPGLGKNGCQSHHTGIVLGSGQPWQQQAAHLFSPGDGLAFILPLIRITIRLPSPAIRQPCPPAMKWLRPPPMLHQEYASTCTLTIPTILTWIQAAMPAVVRGCGKSGSIENADMSEGARWFEPGPGGEGPFEYERIYSNEKSKHGGDPAVPKSPFPYFNVSTEKDWFPATSGLGVTIPFTAWSTEDNGSWEVEARRRALAGKRQHAGSCRALLGLH